MQKSNLFLYERLDMYWEDGFISQEIPERITDNLNPNLPLRDYQNEAFARFIYYLEDFKGKEKPYHLLFNMATGSGKTLIMAGLILYLYERGYRNFLFFVNSKNIIEKTKDNFINVAAHKYLFNQEVHIDGYSIALTEVATFDDTYPDDINICFTTIQQLHLDMTKQKENALTSEHFAEKKIVLLADEAHHMNVTTKSTQEQLKLFNSWEDTVLKIFTANTDNLLLEFTATTEYEDPDIVDKYRDKVLYRYDLKAYRSDKFSKEIEIVRSDFSPQDRMLQAIILNYYKQQVAAKHKIRMKPVILFKAQKTISQSQENKETFHKIIDTLTESDIDRIKQSEVDIVGQAFRFFAENNITTQALVRRLQAAFAPDYCLSVNDDKQAETNQILVNTLERDDNPIRAVFAVHKLNEGWDVLNLFDIVRCYETRDTRNNKPGNTTIAEAQLIGRGARYYPFTLPQNDDKYRRKFDTDTEHELRVLEELHYHSVNNSQYISEIRTALIAEGLMDEKTEKRHITLKTSFKGTDFYKNGIIYVNEQRVRDYQNIRSLDDLTPLKLKQRNYQHTIYAGSGSTTTILEDTDIENTTTTITDGNGRDVPINQIAQNIVFEAIARNPFYRFDNLKRIFPHLCSMQEFRKSENYLGGLAIHFRGDLSILKTNPAEKLRACCDILKALAQELEETTTEFIGTKTFNPREIKAIFSEKTLNFATHHPRVNYSDSEYDNIINASDWFAYKGITYGTDQERGLVKLLNRWWQNAQREYKTFYLIRNEAHIPIYDFDHGRKFYPDYVMYLQKRNGGTATYQIFIEPKGKHLQETDRWKENFLKQIQTKADTHVIAQDKHYRILGVGKFYNEDHENEFRDELDKTLHR